MWTNIKGAYINHMTLIPDERGCVKKFNSQLTSIKDAYVTTIHRGAIKGWHGYRTKKLGFSCIKGKIKLVLWNREDNDFEEQFIGDEYPVTVWVEPGIFTAFKGITEESIVVVLADEEYKDGSVIRISPDNYDWDIKNG